MSELEPEREESVPPVESEADKAMAAGEPEAPEDNRPVLEAEVAPVAAGAEEAEPSPEVDVVPRAAGGQVAEAGVVTELVQQVPGATAAGPAPAVMEEPDDSRKWYVVHCYSGYENKVRHNLEQRIDTMGMKDKIFDVVVPTEEEIEVKDGKRRTVERRVFPGYILVQMILTEESWYVVRNTPGVTGFVGMGNDPTPLRPEEVAQIVKRMEAEAPRVKVTYKIGQKVRIIDGPFNDFIGTVADINMERAKVRIMVSFFGRETPVELDFLQVEKA